MSRNDRTDRAERRGSVYVVVLVTIASVAMLVLAGVALRGADQDASYRHAASVAAARAADAGMVYADLAVTDHDTFMKLADDGVVVESIELGGATVGVGALDEGTGAGVSGSTDRVLVTSTAEAGGAREILKRSYAYTSPYHRLAAQYGAVAYWPLDEPRGTTVVDEPIGGVEGAYPDPDQAGRDTHTHGNDAPLFPEESMIVRVPHDEAYEINAFTVTMWVLADPSGDRVQGVIAKEDPSVGSSPQQVTFFNNGALFHRIVLFNSNNFIQVRAHESYFDDGDWHFVAVSVGSQGLRLFVDGALIDRHTLGYIGLTLGGNSNSFPWTIGGRRDDVGKPGFLDDNLDGSVCRVAVFPGELSGSRIDALMDASSVRDRFSAATGSWRRGP